MYIPTLAARPARETFPNWYILLNDLLFVNFYWGLVYLLPVYPRDGGYAARSLWVEHEPYSGRRKALILSAVVAGVMALVGIAERNTYCFVIFAVMAGLQPSVTGIGKPESLPGASPRVKTAPRACHTI